MKNRKIFCKSCARVVSSSSGGGGGGNAGRPNSTVSRSDDCVFDYCGMIAHRLPAGRVVCLPLGCFDSE